MCNRESKETSTSVEQQNMNGNKQQAGSHEQPVKTFEGHENIISSIATFPDGKRIVTGSVDKTIRIWRLVDGKELKKWQVSGAVGALVILRNGKCMHVVSAEGEVKDDDDDDQKMDLQVWVRDAETGKVVAGPLDGHTHVVLTLDISRDRRILASGSWDNTVILWDTSIWQRKGNPLLCGAGVGCVRFSGNGTLAVSTKEDIQIWDLNRRKCIAQFNGHSDFNGAWNNSLAWTHDGARLLSAGGEEDPVIRSWDTSTWQPACDPWTGHDEDVDIAQIILNPTGTLLASASFDHTVRLWQLPTGTEVARFQHSDIVFYVAFSVDGRSIFSGSVIGDSKKISQWNIPEQVLAAVQSDPLVSKKIQAGPSLGKQRYMKGFFGSEISGWGRNQPLNYKHITHSASPRANAESSSSSRSFDVRSFFDGVRPSSDKGKQKAPEVVGVPLGQATYQDVVGVDDGTRPYVLFFCLSWFQKKKKPKPDPPRPVYDDELEDDESEEGVINILTPTACVQPGQQQDIELKPMAHQAQPEAGPSQSP